jgi:tetratricopeptide (TPR) repeat protein
VRDAVTALRLPQLVALTETRAMLRDAYFTYLRWTGPLVLGTSLDPRAAFWLALAEEQPDLRFESLWPRLCRQTGEKLYPAHYLSIGLLGLRRLPLGEDERLQRVLGGLAAWAAGLPDHEPSKDAFLQQVRMLRWLFPLRSRTDWWERVEPIVQAGRTKPFAQWWGEELGAAPRSGTPPRYREPDRSEVDQVLTLLSRGKIDAQRGRVQSMIREREAWADATGDTHHIVLTASRIAANVVARAPDLALDLTRRAMVWEPNNPFLWNLWGRSLAALGRTALAEAVFWEAMRRFLDTPKNEASHVELARLLAGLNRTDEALAVLREAVRRFPERGPSHVELARVMASTGDLEGAITGLRHYTNRHRDNPVSLTVLGHLLVETNRVEEARPILEHLETIGSEQGVSELSRVIARADAGEAIPVPAYRYPIGALAGQEHAQDREFRELRVDGTVTSADFGLSPGVRPQLTEERQQQLLRELDAVMRDNPDHGYARVVWFERADASDEAQQKLLHDFQGLFELRFVAALRWSDASALGALEEDHREHGVLLRFGRMAIGASNAEDRKRALRWLQRSTPPPDDLVGAFIHRAVCEHLKDAGIDLAKAEPEVLVEHADAFRAIVQRAVRMIGALPAAA